jgi:hypothetical protein
LSEHKEADDIRERIEEIEIMHPGVVERLEIESSRPSATARKW